MNRIHKFLRLPSADRLLLAKSAFLLGVFRLGLWLLPFGTLRCILARMSRAAAEPRGTDLATIDRVVWAVTTASRYLPSATCLAQALAAQVLIGRGGHPAYVCIGATKGEDGRLRAHAWVAVDGVVVLGGPESEIESYEPLLALDGVES